MQLITELDVSYTSLQEQQYQDRLESKAIRYFFFCFKSHVTMHIFFKYITDSSLKMLRIGIFVKHTLCALY